MNRLDEVRQRYDAGEGNIGEIMAAYSLDAIDHAAGLGVDLDFSEDSIQQVEAILGQTHQSRPAGIRKLFTRDVSADALENLSKMYGAYVGEVMRFEWVDADWTMPEDGPFQGAYTIDYRGMLTSPPAKVFKRLSGGSDDNVWAYYRVLTDERDGDLLK